MRRSRLLAALLLLFTVALQGCQPARALESTVGVGTLLFLQYGELVTAYEESLNDVYAASKQAVEDLGYTITDEEMDSPNGKITAEMADGTKVIITMRWTQDETTEIAIRVGEYGDEEKSNVILQEIEANL